MSAYLLDKCTCIISVGKFYPYDIFIVTAAMLEDWIIRYNFESIHPKYDSIFVEIGHMVSQDKIFEIVYEDGQ